MPTQEQFDIIKRTCGATRVVYNSILGLVKKQLENKELIYVSKVSELYETHPFLKGLDSLALANARLNINKALFDFFKSKNGKRKGKKLGFPNFKCKGKTKTSYTTNNQSNSIRVVDNTIKLPKIGFVNFVQHTPLNGEIRSATITVNKDDTIEISVVCMVTVNYKKKQITNINEIKTVGLDMSMSSFYVSSDGEKPNFQREYRLSERKRRRLNKSLHRKLLVNTGEVRYSEKWKKDVQIKKPSKNREKARVKLAKHERHVSNKRKDTCHQLSRKLVNKYDVIVLEDINLQGMSRCLKLGKSVNDLGFGMFRNFLEYKSLETDTLVVRVPMFFASSKTCNDCGTVYQDLKLAEREWVCQSCGVIHDRDENASYNLRDYFVKSINTVGTTEFQACGDETTTLRETLVQVLSLKQESNIVRFGKEAHSFR